MLQSDRVLTWQIHSILETQSALDILASCISIPKKRRSNYDVRHKEALKLCLKDYFELFFPDLAERMVFDSVEYKDKELIALFGDMDDPVQLRIVDSLFMIQVVIDQLPEWIMIHWENQGEKQAFFPERMFHIFCGIYYQYRRLVFSIAMFTDAAKWEKPVDDKYGMSLLSYPIMDFSYRLIKLKHVDAETFEKQLPDNPLTWAYLPLTDYPKEKRAEIKAKAVSGISKTASNDKQKATLLSLIDHSLQLNKEEEKQYIALIETYSHHAEDKMLETIEDYLNEQKEIVREEGREEGRKEGRDEIISALLSNDIEKIIQATGINHDVIQQIAKKAVQSIKKYE